MKRLILGVLIASSLLAVAAWPDPKQRLVFQKIATEFAMPYTLVWSGLALIWMACWRDERRWLRWLVPAVFVLHTLGGNGMLAQYLTRSLEVPFQSQRTYELQPFDAIIVLGGGTDEARNGYAEAALAGDRVVVAARAFHAGLTNRLICTGDRFDLFGEERMDPAEETFEILVGLDIPPDKIEKIGGVNTIGEMQALSKIVQPGQRVGVVTSAWHMRRALRLAKSQGLDLIPLPADFRTDYQIHLTPFEMIPDGEEAAEIKLAIREYLAWIVGR